MDSIEALKAEAREKRDRSIRQARDDYRATLQTISQLRAKLRAEGKTHVKRPPPDDFSRMSAVAATEAVLRELGPMRIVEIVLGIQKRGCRTGDDPRRLGKNVGSSLRYHRGRFVKGKDGRWGLKQRQELRFGSGLQYFASHTHFNLK